MGGEEEKQEQLGGPHVLHPVHSVAREENHLALGHVVGDSGGAIGAKDADPRLTLRGEK